LLENHTESKFTKRGKNPVCAETPWGKAGISICYDIRFPELYRQLRAMDAKFVFVPAAFTVNTGQDHWETLLRARAIENQVYIIAPAQFGIHNRKRRKIIAGKIS